MLNTLKMMLGIELEENDLDKKLNYLLSMATQRLQILLGGLTPPDELEYIIIDVAAARFNRLGSEGLKIHTVEGEHLQFKDDDFAGFNNDIQAYLNSQNEAKRGKVRFI